MDQISTVTANKMLVLVISHYKMLNEHQALEEEGVSYS